MSIDSIKIRVAAVVFAVIGVTFMIMPQEMGSLFGLDGAGAQGSTSLRADLGGLFVGLALLCLIALRTRARAYLVAAATVLAAIVTGRLIGTLADGPSANMIPTLLAELTAIGALGTAMRSDAGEPAARPAGSRRRGLATAAGLLALVGVGAAALAAPGVQAWAFGKAAADLTSTTNEAPFVDDALRVAVCGSSAPLVSVDRAKACVAVIAGGKYYVVDVGPESVENLVLWNIPLERIGGVLLTHFHSDHIGDLGELQLQTWAQGRAAPLPVYGGPGVERVVAGFNEAYAQDQGYRTAHHGERMMPSGTWGLTARPIELDGARTPEKSRSAVVLEDGDLRITALEVEHAPIEPAYAYRFDYRGRSVVITGDTRNHPPLVAGARGADILVSEAIARSMIEALEAGAAASGRESVEHIMHDIQDYHISPEEAARIADDAGVKLLVFYHLLPAPDARLTRSLFGRGVDSVRQSGWHVADDGSLYTLPIDSDEVRIGTVGVGS